MDVVDRQIEFLRSRPEIDAILSSVRGEHPREEVREAARIVDAGHLELWRRWIARRHARAGATQDPGRDNLVRLAAATVPALLATRFTDADVDVREILVQFGVLVEAALDGELDPADDGPVRTRARRA